MTDKFMSGFIFNEDNSILYMVNTKYHIPSNDAVCFSASCLGHRMKNKKLSATYEIMRANVECYSNGRSVSVDFDENGKDEFRVYKVLDEQV